MTSDFFKWWLLLLLLLYIYFFSFKVWSSFTNGDCGPLFSKRVEYRKRGGGIRLVFFLFLVSDVNRRLKGLDKSLVYLSAGRIFSLCSAEWTPFFSGRHASCSTVAHFSRKHKSTKRKKKQPRKKQTKQLKWRLKITRRSKLANIVDISFLPW